MPSTSQQMEMFVRDALARGLSREAIEKALTQAGWTPPQIRDALGAFAEVDFPVPVPRSRPYLSAREAFLYLVLFTTLYLSAYHVGSLCFDFINRAFPDPAQVNEWPTETQRKLARGKRKASGRGRPTADISKQCKKVPPKPTSRLTTSAITTTEKI